MIIYNVTHRFFPSYLSNIIDRCKRSYILYLVLFVFTTTSFFNSLKAQCTTTLNFNANTCSSVCIVGERSTNNGSSWANITGSVCGYAGTQSMTTTAGTTNIRWRVYHNGSLVQTYIGNAPSLCQTYNYTAPTSLCCNASITPWIYSSSNGGWQQTNNLTVCAGGSFNLGTQAGIRNNIVLTLPNGTTDNTTDGDAFFSFNNVTAAQAGTYTITYTNNGCVTTQNFTVTVSNASITPWVYSSSNGGWQQTNNLTVCAGGSFNLGTQAGIRNNIVLTLPNGATDNTTDGDAFFSFNNVTAAQAGTYTITYTANGCVTTQNFTVTVSNASITPWVFSSTNGGWQQTNNLTVCAGGSFNLGTQAGIRNNIVLTLPNGTTDNTTDGDAFFSFNNVTAAQAGNYTITYTINGCVTTQNFTVTVNTLNLVCEANVNNGGWQNLGSCAVSICSGQRLELAVNPNGLSSYQWSGPNGFSGTGDAGGGILISNAITTSQSGNYTVTVNNNGCTATRTIQVTVINPSNLVCEANVNNGGWQNLSSCAVSICSGQRLELAVNPNGLSSYQWSGPNGFSGTGDAGGGILISNAITPAQSGNYTVTVNDNGCTATKTINVTVIDPSTILCEANVNNSGWQFLNNCSITICAGQRLDLSVDPDGLSSYQWTGPNGFSGTGNSTGDILISNAITPAQSGNYTVTVNGCAATKTINVTVIDPSTILCEANVNNSGWQFLNNCSITICAGQRLDLSVDPDGLSSYQWTGPNGFSGTGNSTGDILISNAITPAQSGNYTVTVNGCAATKTINVTVIDPSTILCEANVNNSGWQFLNNCSITICAGQRLDLSVDPDGLSSYQWTGPNGFSGTGNSTGDILISNAITPAQSGNYTVTVNGCAATKTINVTVNSATNAGTDGSTTVCDNSATAINLFGLITGEQAGGTWTRTTGTGGTFNAAAGTYTPALGATTSTFTYTVTGTAPCPNDAAIATVNIVPQANAGTDGATTVCDYSTTAINLFSLITGEQTGGTWTRTTGTGGTFNAVAGTFTPSVGSTTSTFTYTVTGTAPCPNDAAIATVNINTVNAGAIAGSETVCSGGDPVAFTSPTAGTAAGTRTYRWESSTTDCTTGFITIAAATAATYNPPAGITQTTYYRRITISTLNGVACEAASNCLTVTVNPNPNLGQNISANGGAWQATNTVTICDGGSVHFDMDGNFGTNWTFTFSRPDGVIFPGGTNGAANDGLFLASVADGSLNEGIWTVNYTDPNGCSGSGTFTINVNPAANAGTDGSTTVCDNSTTVINLFGLITGEQVGGTWTRTTGTGGTFNAVAGTFTPSVGSTTSTFTYTVTGTAPCPNDAAIATVNINTVNAGAIAGSETVCSGGDPVAFTSPTAGTAAGTRTYRWESSTTDCTTGFITIAAATAATYNPPAGITQTTYFRRITISTLNGVACEAASNCLTVTVNPNPNLGQNISANGGAWQATNTVTICDGGSVHFDMDGNFGTNWTFTFTRPDGVIFPGGTNGAANDGLFLASVADGSLNEGIWTVNYTDPNGCSGSGTFTINVNPAANAGTDGSTTVCDNSTTVINLFGLITGEQTGGSWTRTTGTGGTFNAVAGTFTPSVGSTTSTFTYTVTGTAPCPNDAAIATVNINTVNAGAIAGSETVCSGGDPVAFTSPTAGTAAGTRTYRWESSTTDCTTGFITIAAATAATYNPPAGITQTTYYRRITISTLNGVACEAAGNCISVTVNPAANAGADGATTVCDNSTTSINLFSLITGEQAGGTWTRTTGTGGTFNAAAGTYTPVLGATTSTFTYTVTGTAPCPNDVAIATVNIVPQANAGADGATTVCDYSTTAIDLFSLITGEQAGGTWTRTTGTGGTFNAVAGTFTPSVGSTTSIFTYTVTGTAPCPNDAATATVNINTVNAGAIAGDQTVCTSGDPVAFTSPTAGTAAGTRTYRWESSTTNCTTGFTTIAAATGVTYNPPAGITQTTYYRRITISTLNGVACEAASNCLTVTVNPTPNTPSVSSPQMNVCPATTVNLNAISAALTPSVSGGIFEWHVSNSSGSALVSSPTAVGAGTYYLFEKSPDGCYSSGGAVTANITTCCPTPQCIPLTITKIR